ncbi:hypothetical protein Mal52_51270 [Symmachiella dynata]|uniref:Uncharacterized protein n=1 Tax=Symmachiella dynata TaxID=2527995 RepID=A0A517ZVX0_9PLAN|nr:hypothetical protein Mal52_51270 [Symmachiella dynata]
MVATYPDTSIATTDQCEPPTCFNCGNESDATWNPESGSAEPLHVCVLCSTRVFAAMAVDAHGALSARSLDKLINAFTDRAARVVTLRIAGKIKERNR